MHSRTSVDLEIPTTECSDAPSIEPNKGSVARRSFLVGATGVALGILTTRPGPSNYLLAKESAANELLTPQEEATDQISESPFRGSELPVEELVTEATQSAIDRGLSYLARRQQLSGPNDGAFGSQSYACGVAVTSLGGLAMMCGGSAPGEGEYGKQVNRCVDFVMAQVRDTGYIARKDGAANENMYGHGFATLFLAEAYGMSQRVEVEEKLRKAVQLTVKSQNDEGGWRYEPAKVNSADLSITVCQVMGLRAARDAGVYVPTETRTKCIDYVHQSQNTNGSFRYQRSGGHSTFAMTAAGVTSLYSAGIYDSPAVHKALKHLNQFRPDGNGNQGGYYFYAHYYAIQAMWHAGGEYWNNWYPAIRDELIRTQQSDGSWKSSTGGSEFGTAMACIILQMPFNFLPVFAQ